MPAYLYREKIFRYVYTTCNMSFLYVHDIYLVLTNALFFIAGRTSSSTSVMHPCWNWKMYHEAEP